jgi:hypothetical protein
MLVYNPVFDAYHCVFRMLAILELSESIELDRLRILDFVLCFPSTVTTFKLAKDLGKVKAAAKALENPYREAMAADRVFLSLRPTQDGALGCLAAAGFVARSALSIGRVTRTAVSIPREIETRLVDLMKRESFYFNAIALSLINMPLLGPGGLKDRSGLMEYRYDSV